MSDPQTQGPQELTVTCNQCGSTSMERLDRLEYKCTHCGAVTVVSTEEADQMEAMIANLIRQSGGIGHTRTSSTSGAGIRGSVQVSTSVTSTQPRSVSAGRAVDGAVRLKKQQIIPLLLWVAGLIALYAVALHSDTKTVARTAETVPAEALTLTGREGIDGTEVAILTNTSAKTVELPPLTMTSFNGEFKLGSSSGTVGVDHLLPGERTVVTFQPDGGGEATRFDFKCDALPVVSGKFLHLELFGAKLVHAMRTDRYQLVGMVRNPTHDSLASGQISVLLFNEDHRITGWGSGTVKDLESNEKAAISVSLNMNEARGNIASYEYLIDMPPA